MRIIARGMAIALAALSLTGSALAAPVENVLYSFLGGSDGARPFVGLIADKEGALYGATYAGGSGNAGTVFELTPPAKGQTGWTETVLYRFCSQPSCSDGAGPSALIADKEGALYGTTAGGGSGFGVVFKLTPPRKGETTWTEIVLYPFTGGSDGANPAAGVIADKEGALYGTTVLGGNSCPYVSCGTVFELTPPANGQTGWTETVLYRFTGGSDGYGPDAGLIFDKEGALYGTTLEGGTGNAGTVFELTPPAKGQTGWTETVLYRFCSQPSCSDGLQPYSGLIADKEGALYGTTAGGGSSCQQTFGCGTVFKLTPPTNGETTWTETVLYSFTGGPRDGRAPVAGLIFDKEGALYGTTYEGGSGCPQIGGCGTVFMLTPPRKGQTTWTETVLYIFKGPGGDGAAPYDFSSLIADKEGALYGTTFFGGTADSGTVFKLD